MKMKRMKTIVLYKTKNGKERWVRMLFPSKKHIKKFIEITAKAGIETRIKVE